MKSIYPVVGMKHRGTEALVASLKGGEAMRLVREPTNPFDPNAVQVWARDMHVGFVVKALALKLAKEMDAAKLAEVEGRYVVDRHPQVEVEVPGKFENLTIIGAG